MSAVRAVWLAAGLLLQPVRQACRAGGEPGNGGKGCCERMRVGRGACGHEGWERVCVRCVLDCDGPEALYDRLGAWCETVEWHHGGGMAVCGRGARVWARVWACVACLLCVASRRVINELEQFNGPTLFGASSTSLQILNSNSNDEYPVRIQIKSNHKTFKIELNNFCQNDKMVQHSKSSMAKAASRARALAVAFLCACAPDFADAECVCAERIGDTFDCKDSQRYYEYLGLAAGGAVPGHMCRGHATLAECACVGRGCKTPNHLSPGTCKWTEELPNVYETRQEMAKTQGACCGVCVACGASFAGQVRFFARLTQSVGPHV